VSERDHRFLLTLAAIMLGESAAGWTLRDRPSTHGPLFVANIAAAIVLVWFALLVRPNGEEEL